MELGKWLRQWRREHKLTIKAVAKKCGVSTTWVYILECGKNPTTGKAMKPTVEKLKNLSAMTGTPLEELAAME